MTIKSLILPISALFVVGTASATIVLPTGIEGFQQGDSAPGGDGSVSRAIDLSGITQVNPSDPATWTHSNAWQDDWQGQEVDFGANENFAVIDLGSAISGLDTMYLWNVNENNGNIGRGIQTFELFYATSPTVTAGTTSGTNQAYDFASGGWTQIGGTQTLSQGTGVAGLLPDEFDISAADGAQYIGIRMNSYYSDNLNRIGFSEVVFAADSVPEPSSVALLMLGAAGLLRRRR